MKPPSYEDLALQIEPSSSTDGLQIRLLRSPTGLRPPEPLHLPFEEEKPLSMMRQIEAEVDRSSRAFPPSHRAVRPLDDAHAGQMEASIPRSPEELGRMLFEALFPGGLRECLLTSLSLTETRPGMGLRLRLIFDPEISPRVAALPWELLYRAETRDYLGRQLRTPIVRHLDVQRPALSPTPISELRVLIAVASPLGTPPLDLDSEKRHIQEAWGGRTGLKVEILEHSTLESLRRSVRERPFEVLHFIGHGSFDENGEGILLFEDEDQRPVRVSGTVLADTLKGLHPIRLVFLNACDTACFPRLETGLDPYRGVAASLVMSGISAVLAMQFPISDMAAVLFSEAFYRALASGDPLESAVTEGRLAVFQADPTSWEWATPALFSALPHGQLFAISQKKDPSRHDPEAKTFEPVPDMAARFDQRLKEALELLDHQQFDRAVTAFESICEENARSPRSTYYLALARCRGRRPRSLRLSEVKAIENDLSLALHQADGEESAVLWYLRALLRHDFYRYKGLRIPPPSVEESLAEAAKMTAETSELRRLLDLVPTPQNLVRTTIENRLLDLVQKSR